MNERIKELVEKAQTGKLNLEEFAQLIVQECADFAYTQSIYCKGVPWNQVIKKHFDMIITNDDLAPYFKTFI